MLQSGAVATCPGVYEFLGAVPSERTDGRQGYRANHNACSVCTRVLGPCLAACRTIGLPLPNML
jgi:hypothetical protein